MNSYELLAESMFSHIKTTPEELERQYPQRDLPKNAYVTRIAPSPTGFLHIGTLFTSMIDALTAKITGGIFYFRLEDTDKKREVEGGTDDIINGMIQYGVIPDEGFVAPNKTSGDYGPYKQSDRVKIYQTYIKELLKKNLAYPCFCSEEQRAKDRELQELKKLRTGYYGEFAHCRNVSPENALEKIKNGEEYVIRLRSSGSEDKRIDFHDIIKGKVEMPENDEDIVILKSNGIPTYHFAHAIDDHLMHTTHVIRGDEWLSSIPKHLQLFETLGFNAPKYAHVSPIMKEENGNRRKISKRKDPEAAMHYYAKQGYPADSVIEYLMTIASSGFEIWRKHNKSRPITDFDFKLKDMSKSGALFDNDKLDDVSKTVISEMTAKEVTDLVLAWAKVYSEDFYKLISLDRKFTENLFNIDRGGKKPRKDIAKWNETPSYAAFFFKETFKPVPASEIEEELGNDKISTEDVKAILEKYAAVYDENHDKQEWFTAIKSICSDLGFSPEVKDYKKNPDDFKGHVGDVSGIIRLALTGRKQTPDLHSITDLLGKDTVIERLANSRNL